MDGKASKLLTKPQAMLIERLKARRQTLQEHRTSNIHLGLNMPQQERRERGERRASTKQEMYSQSRVNTGTFFNERANSQIPRTVVTSTNFNSGLHNSGL